MSFLTENEPLNNWWICIALWVVCHYWQIFIKYEAMICKSQQDLVTAMANQGVLSVWCWVIPGASFNTLRPRQNGRHFPDDIFKWIFLNENVWISINISLKFVPRGPINNIPTLVQVMAWRWPGDKPLSEPMMVSSTTHMCVTRPQWVNNGD